jgi:pentatricopeptide repeat protein
MAWYNLLSIRPKDNTTKNNPNNRVATHVLPTATDAVQRLFTVQQQSQLEQVAQPNIASIETVLQIFSQSRFCAQQVWQIYSTLHEDQKTPTVYHAVITSIAKSRHVHAANRAEQVLKEAVENLAGDVTLPLSVETCNHVLTAWAKSGLPYALERAQELIQWMDSTSSRRSISDDTTSNFTPNAQSFTCLMDAYSQQTSWETAVQCERILDNLVTLYLQENDSSLQPTVVTWTIVLQAWMRLAKKKNWNKAARRAVRIFHKWDALYQDGRIEQGPDSLAYQTVLQALARSGNATEAEAWLDKQYEVYQQTGNESLRPAVQSVRCVLEAWTRDQDYPNAMEEAEFVLERYQELLDETTNNEGMASIYRIILFGYCQRRNSQRAFELLNEMVERDMRPDCIAYDRVLQATVQEMNTETETKMNSVDQTLINRAHAIFSLLEKQRDVGFVKPNERVYTTFIRALTKASVPNLAQKARVLLQRMRSLSLQGDEDLRPTKFTYNAVLLAAATENVPSALGIALQTFNEMRTDDTVELDHVSIGNMLRCAAMLEEPAKRMAFIESTFGLACSHGLVNTFILRDLRLMTTIEQREPLLGIWDSEDTDIDDIIKSLPSKWTCKA